MIPIMLFNNSSEWLVAQQEVDRDIESLCSKYGYSKVALMSNSSRYFPPKVWCPDGTRWVKIKENKKVWLKKVVGFNIPDEHAREFEPLLVLRREIWNSYPRDSNEHEYMDILGDRPF